MFLTSPGKENKNVFGLSPSVGRDNNTDYRQRNYLHYNEVVNKQSLGLGEFILCCIGP